MGKDSEQSPPSFFFTRRAKITYSNFFDDKIQRMLDRTCRDKQVYARIAEKLGDTINRFAAIFNIPRNATINPEVEYSVYYSELTGC